MPSAYGLSTLFIFGPPHAIEYVCSICGNKSIGQKWAIKLMNDLTDDGPLNGCGKTTFELINHYLLVLMQD